MRLCAGVALATLCVFFAPAVSRADDSSMARDNRVMAPHGGLELSGSIYLFDYVPTQSGGKQKFEIYAFVLNADATTANGRYGLHVQSRARDTKLRDFFLSNFWFQEAYGWRKTAAGEVHVGKFYRKVGLLWDDSFFGNVQYFNGLKLNPDAGVELRGRAAGGGRQRWTTRPQYFVSNDRVAGSLPGRDAASDSTGTLRNILTARVAPTFSMRAGASLGLGLSGLVGRLDRPAGELRRGAGRGRPDAVGRPVRELSRSPVPVRRAERCPPPALAAGL